MLTVPEVLWNWMCLWIHLTLSGVKESEKAATPMTTGIHTHTQSNTYFSITVHHPYGGGNGLSKNSSGENVISLSPLTSSVKMNSEE